MRVHGVLKIRRRSLQITNWKNHKSELEEDFQGICGYCGKNFKATLCRSEIDHFIPKRKYPEYANKYENLVLSCRVCNNKKREDWPSKDPNKNISDDRKSGYIDPASYEFDEHLERSMDGNIIGKTDVGKYMAKRMGFDYRPISECYKINELYELINKLRTIKDSNDPKYNPELLNDLLLECEDLRQQIHMAKE